MHVIYSTHDTYYIIYHKLKQANFDHKKLSYEKSNDASLLTGSEYCPPAICSDTDNAVPDKEVKNMNLRLT
jgi:hypothetical protein